MILKSLFIDRHTRTRWRMWASCSPPCLTMRHFCVFISREVMLTDHVRSLSTLCCSLFFWGLKEQQKEDHRGSLWKRGKVLQYLWGVDSSDEIQQVNVRQAYITMKGHTVDNVVWEELDAPSQKHGWVKHTNLVKGWSPNFINLFWPFNNILPCWPTVSRWRLCPWMWINMKWVKPFTWLFTKNSRFNFLFFSSGGWTEFVGRFQPTPSAGRQSPYPPSHQPHLPGLWSLPHPTTQWWRAKSAASSFNVSPWWTVSALCLRFLARALNEQSGVLVNSSCALRQPRWCQTGAKRQKETAAG